MSETKSENELADWVMRGEKKVSAKLKSWRSSDIATHAKVQPVEAPECAFRSRNRFIIVEKSELPGLRQTYH